MYVHAGKQASCDNGKYDYPFHGKNFVYATDKTNLILLESSVQLGWDMPEKTSWPWDTKEPRSGLELSRSGLCYSEASSYQSE